MSDNDGPTLSEEQKKQVQEAGKKLHDAGVRENPKAREGPDDTPRQPPTGGGSPNRRRQPEGYSAPVEDSTKTRDRSR
ncbi:MAG TPA: hypothetical protein VMA31_08065 [Bryobacteraceae bacterium]|nr:hypothetical protein [Bryobacteraceae bacterium]